MTVQPGPAEQTPAAGRSEAVTRPHAADAPRLVSIDITHLVREALARDPGEA